MCWPPEARRAATSDATAAAEGTGVGGAPASAPTCSVVLHMALALPSLPSLPFVPLLPLLVSLPPRASESQGAGRHWSAISCRRAVSEGER